MANGIAGIYFLMKIEVSSEFYRKNKIDDTSELFSGNKPIPWYTHLNGFNPSNVERQDIHDGITSELNRATKIGIQENIIKKNLKNTFLIELKLSV